MVRGSELAFRELARRHGNASLCYSPMLRDHEVLSAIAKQNELTRNSEVKTDYAGRSCPVEETAYLLLRDCHVEDTANLVVQLCGSDPAQLSEATTAILNVYMNKHGIAPAGIDLNLGCPQECASREGFGAFLVEKNTNLAISCVASMKKSIDSFEWDAKKCSNRPSLSGKIRLQDRVDDTIELVRKLKVAGADYVSIHCRHRTDKHNGAPDWDSGAKVVDAFSTDELPIILNGGIEGHTDAMNVLERTKCHAVMAATGSLRNHRQYVQQQSASDPSSFEPHYLALEYLDLVEEHPPPSYLYIQKHLRWIFRDALQPENDPNFDQKNWKDWRVKLWSFLVRPYLRSLEQFRMFVALYVQLSGSDKEGVDKLPKSIRHLVHEVTFGSVKKAGKRGKGTKQMELSNANKRTKLG